VRGLLLLRLQGEGAHEAVRFLEQGLSVAHGQQARAWELRIALSLARVWRAEGRIERAVSLLEPLCATLAQRFDTPDLREARALLDEVRTAAS
jgi:predicted ATPase